MSWIQTYTGKHVNPLDFKPEDVDPLDIAHALSNLCRYAGHTTSFYSVAQHSVIVSGILRKNDPDSPLLWMAGLMHDAGEAYLTDLPSPIKQAFPEFIEYENRILAVIAKKFGFGVYSPKIKKVDHDIRLDEAVTFMGGESRVKDWSDWKAGRRPIGLAISPWTPMGARTTFLSRFYEYEAEARKS